MRGLPGILFRRDVVLAVFLILKLVAVLTAGLATDTVEAWTFGVLALVVYGIIAWFAWKRRTVSIWAVTIIMLYEGSGALLAGLDHFDAAPALGVLGIVVAAYLILGALSVFSSRHAGR